MKIPRLVRWIISVVFGLLILMSILRLGYCLKFKPSGSSFSDYIPAFLLGLRFDMRIAAIIGLLMLMFGSIPMFNPFRSEKAAKGWKIFFFIVCTLFFFTYTIDFAHHAYLGIRLNASVLEFLKDAAISADMVWQTYPVIRLLLLIVGGGFLLSWWFASRSRVIARKEEPQLPRVKRTGWIAGTFLLLAIGVFGRLGQYPLRWSDAFGWGNDFSANLSLNPFQSFASSLKFRHITYDMNQVREGYPIMKSYLGVENPTDSLDYTRLVEARIKENSPKNVVVVICESFSGYKSSMWGNPLNTTPYFSEMCKNGVFFDHCFTPHVGTARGVWATITGIPDVMLSSTASRNPSVVDQHTIINDFKGYDKYYFLGGSTSWANIRGLLANNIEGLTIREQDDFDAPKEDVWGISDKHLFLEANKVFKTQKNPFFAIIQTANNHRPYTIPGEDLKYFEKLDLPQETLLKNGFQSNDELNAFRYMDYCFSNFIDSAKKEPYFNETLFVFVGDHGIGGDAGNMLPRVFTDKRLTNEHVPLLFYAPALLAPQRRQEVCSQVDVMPTAAGLVGIPYRNSTLGRDLLDSARFASDSGRSNRAIILDHNLLELSIFNDRYYYYSSLKSGEDEIHLYRNNETPSTQEVAEIKAQMRKEAAAFYNTANYMLFNNKKKN